MTRPITRIVSGGQTGVDRAALDVAIELGLNHGGWCPMGRLAEDGVIPPIYDLQETDSRQYWIRTERNVIDSDATLILFRETIRGGTKFTLAMTRKHGKPCRCVDLAEFESHPSPEEWREWLAMHRVRTLNVAGPRESSAPGIYRVSRQWFTRWLQFQKP